MGDLNIDFAGHRTPAMRSLKALCKEFNLTQRILTPKRVTGTTSTILDHAYTNIGKVAHAGIIETFTSDHYPIYLILKKKNYFMIG